MKKIIKKILERKILSGSIALLLVIGGYLGYNAIFSKDAVAQYALAQVQKGTLVVSIAGSGQVSVSNQVDIKPKVSGDVVYVGVKNGQEVKTGTLITQLDAGDAQKAVRDAETALETAQLELEKFKQPPKNLDVEAIEADIATAEKSKTDAEKIIQTAYKNLLNSSTVATPNTLTTNETAPTITGTYQKDIEGQIIISVYQSGAGLRYNISSTPASIAAGGGEVSTTVAQPLHDTGLYLKFGSTTSTQPGWIISLPNKSTANYVSNLETYENALESKEETIKEADLAIAQNKQEISDLYQPDLFELREKELVVKQKENALKDAKEKLADYFVRAPFAGIITNLDVEKGEGVSSATVLGTLVTKQKIAEASMNEIDIAKVKVDQKSTLTFDAIPDLTVNGQVAEMDTVGTVSQGVVTYNIKIGFDVQDDRVKPGMSVSAEIVTDTKPDVLLVPNSAVKSPNENHYVEVVDSIDPQIALTANVSATQLSNPPRRQQVEVGISNNEAIEIISGLKEGDIVVVRTLQGGQNSPAQASQRPGLFGGGGR